MKKIIFNCVPPFANNIPSAALSILKTWLIKHNYDSSIIYWNLHLHNLQNDFVWNSPSILDTSNNLALYMSYIIAKSNNPVLYDSLKKILQGSFPRYLSDQPSYYDNHINNFADKMDDKIDMILSEIDFPDTLLFGFSMKLDGWIVSSIIAEKIKRIAPNIPVVIGGINTKENAIAFLENFPQFDIAMWGEGEEPLIELVEVIKTGCEDYSQISNIVYRFSDSVVLSEKRNSRYIDLSEEDIYPNYDDYFILKKELKFDYASILPIEGSRGCHWNKCKFCYLNTGYCYRLKSIDKICKEIKCMIEKYQVYSFEFLDNDFIGLDIEKARLLLERLKSIKKDEPRFNIVTAEVITKGLDHLTIKQMFDAGIVYVQIGYESTSNNLLKKINKKNTFASNLFYVKIATLYNIPLLNVNLIVNMPDETIEDILESIDNLKFLRFFLHPVRFKHFLIPVQVDSSSRYYSNVKNETAAWIPSMLAYDFLKEFIIEKDHWEIFNHMKQFRHYQWDSFKNVEKYYLDNKHTYSITKKNKIIKYCEYINGRKIQELSMEETSLEARILYYADNKVISLKEISASINNESKTIKKYNEDRIINAIRDLSEKGLIYSSLDFDEIVSILNY